jgi:hypothetical protein
MIRSWPNNCHHHHRRPRWLRPRRAGKRSFAGRSYEIDLGKKNLAAPEKALKPYIEAARTVGRRGSSRPTQKSKPGRSAKGGALDLSAVRAWADAQGIAVAARGRIASNVMDAFHKAQPNK